MKILQWIRRPANLVGFLIVCGFLALLVYLLLSSRGEVLRLSPRDVPSAGTRSPEWEEWYGIYFQGKKIGYASESRKPIPDGYRYHDATRLWLNVSGKEVQAVSTIEALTNRELVLQSFAFELESEQSKISVDGTLKGSRLVLGVDVAGERTEQEIEVKEPPVLGPMMRDHFFSDPDVELEVGKSYSIPFLDPSFLASGELQQFLQNAELQIEVLGIEELKVGEEMVSLYRLKESFKEIEAISWVTPDGRMVKEFSPAGFVIIRETREQAQEEDTKSGPLPDIITALAVPAHGTIRNPRETDYLKAHLQDAVLDGFDIAGHRQTLRGREVEVRKENLEEMTSYVIPWSPAVSGGDELKEYLKSTLFIPLEKGILAEKAVDASGGHDDSLKAARSIMSWVYSFLEKEPTFSIPNALQILEEQKGDCNEHALLFTALARAVGLPARTVAGVVYMEDRFFYHAWAEVYVGSGEDGWVSVDPTFGQFPADATHIRFLSGGLDRQLEIARFVNFLKVEILETE